MHSASSVAMLAACLLCNCVDIRCVRMRDVAAATVCGPLLFLLRWLSVAVLYVPLDVVCVVAVDAALLWHLLATAPEWKDRRLRSDIAEWAQVVALANGWVVLEWALLPSRTLHLTESGMPLAAGVAWSIRNCSCRSAFSSTRAKLLSLFGVLLPLAFPDVFICPDTATRMLVVTGFVVHNVCCTQISSKQRAAFVVLTHAFPIIAATLSPRSWYTARAVAVAGGSAYACWSRSRELPP